MRGATGVVGLTSGWATGRVASGITVQIGPCGTPAAHGAGELRALVYKRY